MNDSSYMFQRSPVWRQRGKVVREGSEPLEQLWFGGKADLKARAAKLLVAQIKGESSERIG